MACWDGRAWGVEGKVDGGGAERIAWFGQGKWRCLPSAVYGIEICVQERPVGARLRVVRGLVVQHRVLIHLCS